MLTFINISKKKTSVFGVFFFLTLYSFGQVDTSDVFIIGEDDNNEYVDTIFDYSPRTSIKYEIARLALGELTFAVERVLKDRKTAIEPEITFVWLGQDTYFFKSYTDNQVQRRTFFAPSGSVGIGLALKRYISKGQNAPYGPYFSIKIRNRFAQIDQEVDVPFFNDPLIGPAQYNNGFFNLLDLSLNIGLSIWKKDWFNFDFLIGASVTHSYYEYANYETVNNIRTWTPMIGQLFMPTINFGFRLGISPQFFRLKFNEYRHVFGA